MAGRVRSNGPKQDWPRDLLALAQWAIQSEDNRYRFIHAKKPLDFNRTPGILLALETSVVLSIYEAALAKGYKQDETIDYERDYPEKSAGNGKRADLAFKDPGPGQNWGYVEVKHYGGSGKKAVSDDISKLKKIKTRSQRWILCYRVRRVCKKHEKKKPQSLKSIFDKHFKTLVMMRASRNVRTITEDAQRGTCDIVLARLK